MTENALRMRREGIPESLIQGALTSQEHELAGDFTGTVSAPFRRVRRAFLHTGDTVTDQGPQAAGDAMLRELRIIARNTQREVNGAHNIGEGDQYPLMADSIDMAPLSAAAEERALFVRIRAGERRRTPGAAVAVPGAQIQGSKPVPRRARGQGSSETTRAPRPGRRVRRQSSGGAACPSAKLWRKRGSRPA